MAFMIRILDWRWAGVPASDPSRRAQPSRIEDRRRRRGHPALVLDGRARRDSLKPNKAIPPSSLVSFLLALSENPEAGWVVRSQQSRFGETEDALADDEVIEHTHVHETQTLDDAFGDELIGLAGLGNPRGRVIVKEEQTRRIVAQTGSHDFPWVHGRAIDRALEQVFHSDHAVARVKEDGAKNFSVAAGEPHPQVLPGECRRGQSR